MARPRIRYRAALCGPCNAYLADLDRNLCDHHHLAAMIVFGRLRGTKDRTRKTVHGDLAFDTVQRHLTISGGAASIEGGTLTIRNPGNPSFDSWKFSRGLHRVALGVLAARSGEDLALREGHDDVRRYIRSPRDRREYWPYFQRPTDTLLGDRNLPTSLAAPGYRFSFAIADAVTYVYMNLFVSEFVVALQGNLRELTDTHLNQFACFADAPEPHSRRSWQWHDGGDNGEPVVLTPEVFGR